MVVIQLRVIILATQELVGRLSFWEETIPVKRLLLA